MKKRINKITTKVLCICLSLSSLMCNYRFHASAIYQEKPTISWDDMEQVDDGGLFAWTAWTGSNYIDYKVYLVGDGGICLVYPYLNQFSFIIQNNVERQTAKDQVSEILLKYYPEYNNQITDVSAEEAFKIDCVETNEKLVYTIYDNSTEQIAEKSNNIFSELRAQGLISDFYDCGQIGTFSHVSYGYLTAYPPEIFTADGLNTPFDEKKVLQYLNDNKIDCNVKFVERTDEFWGGSGFSDAYCIIPNEPLTFQQHFDLMCQLYKELDLSPLVLIPATTTNNIIYGNNLLATKGDINLDGSINVSDAVLTARIIAEDATLNLTSTGMNNADVDGDGLLTIHDTATLLRRLAKME